MRFPADQCGRDEFFESLRSERRAICIQNGGLHGENIPAALCAQRQWQIIQMRFQVEFRIKIEWQ